jgi:mannose-6-phosphate isomerase-like protein (cupin superfamily)
MMTIRKGFVIENPLTHSRVMVLETEAETAGRGWLLEIRIPAHMGPDVPEHLHLTWTETFEILSGTASYKLNRETKTASAGMTIVMPPRQPHVHPWNAGDTELVYRQRNDFGAVDPEAVQDELGVFATRAGLMRDGLCDERGRPRNPLQLAVTLKILVRHGGYDAKISIAKQNFLAATLGTLGGLMGYKAVYPKYLWFDL